jgi:enediyne biosynthesis protein E4
MRDLLTVVGSMVILLGAGCAAPTVVQPDEWTPGDGYRSRALAVAGRAPGFSEVPSAIEFENRLSDAAIVENRNRMNGSGVAVGDADGDGRPDVFFAAMEGPARLYRNMGNWEFADVTGESGLDGIARWSTGAVFADVDGDEDLDLFVTALTAPNALYLNDGSGRYMLSTAAGLGSRSGSMTAAFADTDGDGDLDLYVSNYKRIALRDSLSPDRLLFANILGDGGEVMPELRDHYRLQKVGSRQMRLELGEEDEYYRNQGGGVFLPAPILGVSRDWGMTARLQDISGDGVPDLYVANDFESPDYLLLGDGNGGWNEGVTRLAHTSNSSMAVDVADVNRDGYLDLFIPDMLSPDPVRRRVEVGTAGPMTGEAPQYMQNTLQLGREDGSFAEVSWAYGVAASEWSWSGIFLDVDLDGWDDLLLTTGHSFDVQDADAQVREREAIRRVRSVEAFRSLITEYPRLPLPNMAFRNESGNRFVPVQDGWGLGESPDISHGMALGDFDGDGDLDIVTNRLNAPAGVFRNNSGAPRIAVRLRGRPGNTRGVGSRVTLEGGGFQQTREVISGGQYLSGSESLLSFAAPSDTMTLTVDWRSGLRQVLEMPGQNRLYEFTEPLSDRHMVGGGNPAATPGTGTSTAVVHPFRSIDTLDTYLPGMAFDDRQLQALVPNRLSREGPFVAVGDLKGDGGEYVVVGSDAGGRPSVYRVEDGALVPMPGIADDESGWAAVAISQGVLFAATAGYRTGTPSQLTGYRLDPDGRLQEILRVPLGGGAPGPIATGDVDGDGDEDIFVGMRFLPGRYPESSPSLLLRRDGDLLDRGTAFELGMVTGAVFADVDADGDLDLVTASEWGGVRLHENDGTGAFSDRTAAWGLEASIGLWRGIAAGDLNGDGLVDLVATNWGWNSRLGRAGAEDYTGRGLRLYYADVDSDGRPDPVLAEYRGDLDDWSPIESLRHLRAALPVLSRRTTSFHEYASSTMDQITGPESPYLEAKTLASTAWINQNGRFERRILPLAAQLVAATGVLVTDLAGNGRTEIVMAQNFFPVLPEETMRQDAGRGLILVPTGNSWRSVDLGIFADQRLLAEWSGGLILTASEGPTYLLNTR